MANWKSFWTYIIMYWYEGGSFRHRNQQRGDCWPRQRYTIGRRQITWFFMINCFHNYYTLTIMCWTVYYLLKPIIRLPNIHVGGLLFYHGFFLSFFFSSATRRARWMELSHIWPHGRKQVRFENACLKFGVSLSTTNRGPKNHLFRRFHNLGQL